VCVDSVVQRPCIDIERTGDGFHRTVDVGVGMRRADDERRRDDPAQQELLQEQRSKFLRSLPLLVQRRVDEVGRPTRQGDVIG